MQITALHSLIWRNLRSSWCSETSTRHIMKQWNNRVRWHPGCTRKPLGCQIHYTDAECRVWSSWRKIEISLWVCSLLQMFVPKDTSQGKQCHINKLQPLASIQVRKIKFPYIGYLKPSEKSVAFGLEFLETNRKRGESLCESEITCFWQVEKRRSPTSNRN